MSGRGSSQRAPRPAVDGPAALPRCSVIAARGPDGAGAAAVQSIGHLLVADHFAEGDAVEHGPDLGLEGRALQRDRHIELPTRAGEILVQLLTY